MISKRLFTSGFIMILTMTMLLCMAGKVFADDLPFISVTSTTTFDKPSDFNYKRDDWFANDPNNILPWPDQRISNVTDNTAYTYILATPGHAGQAIAETGVSFQLSLIDFDSNGNIINYDYNDIADRRVTVNLNASYNIMANYTLGTGSGNAAVASYNFSKSYLFDWIGYETNEIGTRSGTVNLKIETTIGQLLNKISLTAFCQAHSATFDDPNLEHINTSAASVTLNSIKITPKYLNGLFIGVQETTKVNVLGFDIDVTVKGDLGASRVGSAFAKLDNIALDPIVLQGNVDVCAGVPVNLVKAGINAFNSNMIPGDKFLLYISSHGGTDATGSEYVKLGSGLEYELADYDLANILAQMDPKIAKWVIIDACNSGGFKEELSHVNNLCLLASCAKGQDSYFDKFGLGIFDEAVFDAFSTDANGKLKVDKEGDGFDLNDLYLYVKYWPGLSKYTNELVYKGEFGDPIIFTLDMWNPVAFKTDDFVDGFPSSTVPIPPSLMLFGTGLVSLVVFSWRKLDSKT